jgi:hypothetical protein
LHTIERYYKEIELPKVRAAISDFKKEVGIWGRADRWLYLIGRLIEVQGQLDRAYLDIKDEYAKDGAFIDRGLRGEGIEDLEAFKNKISAEIARIENIIQGKSNQREDLTEKIVQAKQYPIENLADVKRGMALCPFHGEKNASMGIKNNRYHCFACGARGDVIDFLMNRDGISFKEAVEYLAG